MDIEQLKLILETVGAAGEGAFVIALLWIAKGYFTAALGFTVIPIVIVKIAGKVQQMTETYQLLNRIRAQVCGQSSAYGSFTKSEIAEITAAVDRGMEKK